MSMNGIDPTDFSTFEDQFAQRHQPRRENLILRFFRDAVPNTMKSEAAGREICDMVDMVSIIVPGSRDEMIKPVGEQEKQRFGPQYQHWLSTQEQPVEGQPLDQVPWLNVAQVREMQHLNIKTLEQLAALSDTAIGHLGMGARDMVNKAKAYIEAAKGSAELTHMVAKNAELEREVASLKESIKEINARYEAVLKQRQEAAAPVPVEALVPQPQAAPAVDIAALIRAEIAKQFGKQGE